MEGRGSFLIAGYRTQDLSPGLTICNRVAVIPDLGSGRPTNRLIGQAPRHGFAEYFAIQQEDLTGREGFSQRNKPMIYTARPQRPQRGIFCLESLRPLRSCCEILSSAFASLREISLCLVAALPLCAFCAFLRLFFLGWHRLSEKKLTTGGSSCASCISGCIRGFFSLC